MPEMAPAPVASFSFGLTSSDSDASLTSDNRHQTANLIPDCCSWTNEKHNMYLDYLEASFVRQLHNTMDSVTWCCDQIAREGNISQRLSANLNKTVKEISSLRDVQYHEINLGEDHPHSHNDELTKTHSQDKNLKINRQRSSCSEERSAGEFCHHDSIGSVTEGTDQNFVDEGCQNYGHGAFRAKKLKMATLEDTRNSEKIPIGQLHASDKWVRGLSLHGGEGEKYA